MRSFLDSFPYASLWTTEIHEMLLVGSMQPIVLNVPSITANFDNSSMRGILGQIGVASPAALLATWVTGREGLERYAARAPAVTDDRPRIEYASWVRRGEFVRVLPYVFGFRTHPPLTGADEAFLTQVREERKTLMNFCR